MNLGSILVILIVALIVIKPERLPEIMFLLGRLTARFKLWIHTFRV